MDIKTCTRGFSFMPKNAFEGADLKYVEKNVLEQAWRATRRERLKQQEQKIWEEFVQERDVVSSVCQDDPYQFLHELPEACIKELLEIELQRMRNEQDAEKIEQEKLEEMPEPAPPEESDNQHVVTFIEESDKEDMFHIFDDEKDDEVSGPEEENLNESGSPPCTVRERHSARSAKQSPTKSLSPDKASSKSSENVTHMIESSIYCAKVKDLRLKICEELLEIMGTLDRQDLTKIEPEEVAKMLKRSTEFCARFNRIHMYQLQRQLHDIQRHNAAALPFAKHTQFQSQMVRIGSLHQNLLQAAQIFHKSIVQTACIRESGDLLKSLLRTIAEATSVCRETSPPSGLAAAKDLYTDEVQINCNKLEDGLNEYNVKLSEYLDQFGQSGKSMRGRYRGKKKSIGTWSKSGTKSGTDTDARLSMYSLDTLRLNLNSKSSISKDHSSGTSKLRGGLTTRRKQTDKEEPPKSQRKSPKNRRPLMRDPAAGKPRRKQTRDLDVPTLVETVTACASSHISREETPIATPRDSKDITPRRQKDAKSKDTSRKSGSAHKKVSRSPKSAKKYNSPVKNNAGTPKSAKNDSAEAKTKDNSNINNKSDKTNISDVALGLKKVNNDTFDKRMPDMKVEVKPKSPEQIIEQGQRLKQGNELRGQESPKNKCNVEQGFKENVAKMDHELTSPKRKQDGNTDGRKTERDRNKVTDIGPGSCEVSRLLRQLCGGDASGTRNERVTGAKNAQLLCVNGSSPRQPSTPQLLRILEETIQKKAPKTLFPKASSTRDADRLRLPLSVPPQCADRQLQYRGKFVQHMLTSAMYANSAVGKPWEVIGSVSDQIIDELLLGCAKEMELTDAVQEMYRCEMR